MIHEKRACIAYIFIVCAMALLTIRLYNLSKPEALLSMSALSGQYTGSITVCERQGFIYDRKGNLISHNLTGKITLVNPEECDNPLYYAEKISEASKENSASEIYEKILNGVPFKIETKDYISENLSGVYTFNMYEEKEDTALHFLGYTNADGDGVMGLRKAYNDKLTKALYAVVKADFDTNAKRMSLSSFDVDSEKYTSISGVVATIDKDIQVYCDSLESHIQSGGVLVCDVSTGEILALSSFPSFSVNSMAEVLKSDRGELINRITSSFTPGSVFKMIVCLSALDMDEELFDYKYTCRGSIEVEDNTFHCHNRYGHGELDMADAFAESCNTYFISLGEKIGLNAIAGTMKKLELDEKSSASFLEEQRSFFIDESNDKKGYLANISFGQGDLSLSPLDMMRVTIAASTGYLTELSSVKGEIKGEEFVKSEDAPRKRVFSQSVIEKMLFMMEKCVEDGTGKSAKSDFLKICGKTATAQTGTFDGEKVEKVHKWFCGIDDKDNPSTAVVVLCDFTTKSEVSPGVVCRNILEYMREHGK